MSTRSELAEGRLSRGVKEVCAAALARALTGPRRLQRLGIPYYGLPEGPRALLGRARAADPAGGREAPLRIKKIAERRTIWGGGRLRRKRGAEDHGDGREQPQERGARRLDRLHLPGGAGAQQRRPGLGHGRHPARTSWTSSFVLSFPSSTSRRAGRPAGSTPLRVRTVFFEAVMFPLHCYPHIVLLPRVSFPLSPQLIRSSQSKYTIWGSA